MSDDLPKRALILINLGTPEATGYFHIRRYLQEFLSDRRVVNLHPFFWQIILHFLILPRRPFRTGKQYQKIWNDKKDGSPLRFFTRKQAEGLQEKLAARDIKVEWAMRYGHPSVAETLQRLLDENYNRILVLPLYPQYSASTFASAQDAVFNHLLKMTNQPALLTFPSFAGNTHYIAALAECAQKFLQKLPFTPEKILLSFHGIPKKYAEKDYHYPKDCALTARKLREKMGMTEAEMPLTFQSRFGAGEWLKPYTVDVVQELARTGTRKIAVMAPGFLSDCLETLYELGEEIKEVFLESGGEEFALIPCLNDSPEAINFLEKLVLEEAENF